MLVLVAVGLVGYHSMKFSKSVKLNWKWYLHTDLEKITYSIGNDDNL